MHSPPPPELTVQLPAADAAFIGAGDVSPYLSMLVRQLADNLAVSNRFALSLRWLASPLADSFTGGGSAKELDLAGAALVLTGSRNHFALGGFAVEPSIDVIRLELRAAGLKERAFSYAGPGQALPPLCPLAGFGSGARSIKQGSKGREAKSLIAYGDEFERFAAHAGAAIRLPTNFAANWLKRQLALLSASHLYFTRAFAAGEPEVLLCHGGLNYITSGAKLAAAQFGIPAFEVQHGALNMLDPMRSGSRLPPYTGERLLAWIQHGASGREHVIGPPHFRLHQCLAPGGPASDLGFPATLVRRYSDLMAVARREREKVDMPPVLVALQKSGGELEKIKRLGLDVAPNQLWMRGHPGLSPVKPARNTFNPSTLPLGALLAQTGWLLTGHSSVAVEAAAFGCGVLFLSPDGSLLYPGIESSASDFAAYPNKPSSPAPVSASGFGEWVPKLRAAKWLAG